MHLTGPVPRAAALSWMLISTLTGCATTMDSSATDGPGGLADASDIACEAFQPIVWSGHDTDATIRQIKQHNASYAALCPKQPAH